MTADAVASTRRFTFASLIALLLSLAVWTGIFGRVSDAGLRFDKDILYVYLCGVEYGAQASHNPQDKLVDYLVAASAHEHYVYRAKMRAAYCNNYLFTSLSMYAAGQVQRSLGLTDPAKDFPEFLFHAMRWGVMLSGALVAALCFAIVFWTARGSMVLPLFGAIALAALFYWVVPTPNISWSLYQQTPAPPAPIVSLHRTFALGLHTWINPTGAFSPFSIFPRCLCAMITFAAFALRWSGRGGLAYWAPIAVSFVHQSEAPILLGVMIACDLVRQPKALLRPACFVPILATVVLTALRERMFSIMGYSWVTAAIIVAALIGIAVLAFAIPRIRQAVVSVWSMIDRLRMRWFERLSLTVSDTVVILVGWVAVVILCYVLSRHDQVYRVGYLWSELYPRYVGLFQLPVFTGLIYAAWPWVLKRRATATREAMVGVSCLMLVLAGVLWLRPWIPEAALVAETRAYDPQVRQQHYVQNESSFSITETPWYYLMLRDAYLGGKDFDAYFSKK
jgi:hypothetical protein